MRNLQLSYIKWFCITITVKKAESLHLKHFRNIYGIHPTYRSLWIDNRNQIYKVK